MSGILTGDLNYKKLDTGHSEFRRRKHSKLGAISMTKASLFWYRMLVHKMYPTNKKSHVDNSNNG